MKKRLLFSVVSASLLLSVNTFASTYQNSVSVKEQMNSKAEIQEFNSKEAFLAKTKRGIFKQEANKDETKRFKNVVNKNITQHKNTLAKPPKEFVNGFNDLLLTIHSIKTNKTNEAEKSLQKAKKEFKIALDKNPKLKLIPVADDAQIISFNGNSKLIEDVKKTAIELLKENNTQLAIDILNPLQDEIIVTTQLVPVKIYPKAIDEALKALKNKKNQEAFDILVTSLNARQVDTIVIPIPLITAQDMVLEASKLEKSHKKEALDLLTKAEDELKKSMLLGYTQKDSKEYLDINNQIKTLKKEINGKNTVEKLYTKLLKSFHNIKKHTK